MNALHFQIVGTVISAGKGLTYDDIAAALDIEDGIILTLGVYECVAWGYLKPLTFDGKTIYFASMWGSELYRCVAADNARKEAARRA